MDLGAKTCSYRLWALSGIPCPHVIACIRETSLEILDFVHSSLLLSTYGQVYDFVHFGYVVYMCYSLSPLLFK